MEKGRTSGFHVSNGLILYCYSVTLSRRKTWINLRRFHQVPLIRLRLLDSEDFSANHYGKSLRVLSAIAQALPRTATPAFDPTWGRQRFHSHSSRARSVFSQHILSSTWQTRRTFVLCG